MPDVASVARKIVQRDYDEVEALAKAIGADKPSFMAGFVAGVRLGAKQDGVAEVVLLSAQTQQAQRENT